MSVGQGDRRPVFLVSGGTGSTARSVLQAALRQFAGAGAYTRTFHHLEDHQLDEVFREAARVDALVVWTLVGPSARERAAALATAHGVRHVDVLGPLLDRLEEFLEVAPHGIPGLLHRADEHYFARIAALEFTLAADDGRNPQNLSAADIILVGVSRTGKTPLSTYLAHKGFKVGNQPIVLDHPLPPRLHEVDQRRIFALDIDPHALQRIRTSRMHAINMPHGTNYCDMDYILAELEYAHKLYKGNRWPVIDVTSRAIEETAGLILRRLEEHGLIEVHPDAPVG
ncbi:MAG: kinase/pyrophosphorylase [Alphaproteobacteria bacterium]|nr:kinase/pyrophosphorylase [Alphaproteobacteria bacterium]